jgi:hypothetical protein
MPTHHEGQAAEPSLLNDIRARTQDFADAFGVFLFVGHEDP